MIANVSAARIIMSSLFLCVFKNMKLWSIPERYILNHWKKFACPKFVGFFFIAHDVIVAALNDVVSNFYSCFGFVKDTKHMSEFRRDMRELKDKHFNTIHSASSIRRWQRWCISPVLWFYYTWQGFSIAFWHDENEGKWSQNEIREGDGDTTYT